MSSITNNVDSQSQAEAASDASGIGLAWNSEKPRKWDPWEDGEYAIPQFDMPNEVNFLGGLGPNVGHPRNGTHIMRPTTIQQIYSMRTRNQPVFTFCEDPRKANNCVRKKEKIDHTNLKRIRETVERVKLAQNVETPPPSDFSEDPTELFDTENPLNLDLQGLDRKETFQRDEQQFQNQREYLVQKRHINKHRMTVDLQSQFKSDQLQDLYRLPAYYDISRVVKSDDLLDETVQQKQVLWTDKYRVPPAPPEMRFQRPIPEAIPYVPPPLQLASLTRSADKPKNVATEELYYQRHLEKMTALQMRKQHKLEERERVAREEASKEREARVVNLGESDFARHFADEYGDLQAAYTELPAIYHEHKFPHTLRETKYLRRQMNRHRREKRDEAIIRNRYAKSKGHMHPAVEADEQSEKADELSDQSTDDEDTMSVGAKQLEYRLRGFHYKLGETMRGLRNVKPQRKCDRPQRKCITRSEWFDEMAPTRQEPAFFKDNRSSIPSKALPSDPDYKIFSVSCVQPRPIHVAPIHEMVYNAGEEPRIIDAKVPKIKRPRYVKVRKFNLTAYMFGAQRKARDRRRQMRNGATENKYGVSFEMIQKCDIMYKRNKNRNRAMRHNRMRTLGIPIVTWTKAENDDEEEELESLATDYDWVPAKVDESAVDQTICTSADAKGADMFRGLSILTPDPPTVIAEPRMTAPDFREPTFRLRAGEHRAEQSPKAPSRPYELPRLSQLASDIVLQPNLQVKRTQFTDLFQSRFHHPHQLATQHKSVYVKYLPKLPQFLPPPPKKERTAKAKPFQRAQFRDGRPLQEDLSKPKAPLVQRPIDEETNKLDTAKKTQNAQSIRRPVAKAYKSREPAVPADAEATTAEKSSYLHLLHERHNDVVTSMGELLEERAMVIDELQMVQKLRAELDSIKSCDSSQSSSECTKLSQDSGSYLELQGHRVPCDYVNKSNVPFEEIDRCRVVTGPLCRQDEYYGPYYSVPFAGQKMDMRQLSLPKDRFFTSSVRSRYGIRNRLQVPTVGFDFDKIGPRQRRLISQLATEWDPYYQNEILRRPRVRKFKPRTILAQARDALRKQFQSNYIQEAITEHALVAELEQRYCASVEHFRDLCLPLFSRWQESYYRAYMRKMQDVKPFYERTDQLKRELQLLRNECIKLDMSIIYKEDDWRRRTIMQNFHYLLADPDWRARHDWIHLQPDGQLENFRTSIQRRATVNVRVRDKDSAWAVKEFYERFFENELAREVHVVFPSARHFMCGLLKLKMKSFMCLLELHFAMWVLANLTHGYRSFCEWSGGYIAKRQKFVRGRCAKKYFSEAQAADLSGAAGAFVAEPLQRAVAAPLLRTLIALCEAMFVQMIPRNVRDNMKSGATVVDKFTMIVNAAMQLLENLQPIPHDTRIACERKVRLRRSFISRQSVRACDLELRIKHTAAQMRKSLAPPSRPKPSGHPLPRSYLPARAKRAAKAKVEITDLDKLFYKAFTDKPPQHMEFHSADDAAILRSLEANCIPFYFDYFLRQRNYFPTYDFKTEIELMEGSELEHFHYEDVLDDVQRMLAAWEQNKQQRIEEHIQQTWHLYAGD